MTHRGEPRFRLLGTMAADTGPGGGPDGGPCDRPVDLGHDRQRCVLAVLLVDANRPVAVPVLLDRAWGDRLPQRPRDALYSYLSRLRPILAATGARLERCRGGYTLGLDPLDVDLHRFDDLVRRSRTAPDAGHALAELEQALALWTGEAFGALDTPWLNSMRLELAQRHRAAERARDDLALQLGRHDLVAPDLLVRAGRDPLDERLAGQAMLALYRCGQRALALTCYEDLRHRLAEGLGTEPSEPLRRLHQQMLRADPALAAPDTRPPSDAARAPGTAPVPDIALASMGSAVVPHQLPPGPASFTGRDAELADLTAAFGESAPDTGVVLSLIGAGGIGKTWLALRWAHQHRHRFPDGQLYVNLRGFDPGGDPLEPAVAIRSFLAALGVPAAAVPGDPDGQAALYRSLLADRRVLVVLDNARDSAQVVPLLPGSPGCAVLVTCRRRLTGLVAAHGARPVPVGLMSDAEARQLLRARLGAARLAAAPAAVESLLAQCAGLPLALGIVAAQAATDPAANLADLAGALADRETRLDLLDAGELALGLRAVLDSSVRTLTAPAARMLGHLALAPGPDTGLAAAVSAAGVSEGAAGVRRALRELVDANLISDDGQQRYRMHDLVRLYAIELSAATDGGCALTRLLDHYLHSGHAALELLRPLEQRPALAPPAAGVRVEQFADRAAATGWFAAEYQVLAAAVRSAAAAGAAGDARAGADRLTWQLAWVCLYQLDQRGDWAGQIAVSELALAAARRSGDDTALAHAHTGLGRGYAGSGRFDAARVEYNHALAAYRRLGDPVGEGFAYRKLARVHAVQGCPADALAEDRRALARFEAAGHDYGRAVVLNALGWHLAHLGRYAEAVDCCQQAIAVQQRLPDPHGEALSWDSIAYAWFRQGDYNLAVTGYRRAARLIHEQRNHLLESEVMEHLGDAYAALGSQRAACAAWRRAADLLAGLGHPHVEPVHAKLRRAGVTMADATRSLSA